MLKGILFIVIAAVCWGLGGVSGQYLHDSHGVDMVWLVMCRQIPAGFIFLLYASFIQKQDVLGALKNNPVDMFSYSFFGLLGAQLGFYYTIGLCNAATATVLQYSAPIFVMLWMAFKERRMPSAVELVGVAVAVTGVFLISTHGSLDSLAISPEALAIGLISALSYAFYSIKPVEMLKHYTSTTILGWGQLLSGLALIIWRNPFKPAGNWDLAACLAFAYLIIMATVICYVFFLKGLPIVGPTRASLISCAEPLSSIIAVVLLLDTRLLLADYIGMACIIFTVLFLSLNKAKTPQEG